jgi:hypothetical protein
MPVEQFVDRKFQDGSIALIKKANEIIESYQAQGFTLTLRQLYYQFVARDIIPNKLSEYKRLGSVINDGRLAGLIDWSAIEDRTRNVRTTPTWDDPSKIVETAAKQYKEDLWDSQEFRPEVWIEKDALVGVIEPACRRYRVPYFACRGYTSQSESYAAGKRFEDVAFKGQTPVVLHLGDHDPSGIDMTRDNADRLTMFAREDVDVRRLALNMAQIDQYNPPPNPAKETDSRSESYIAKFGNSSWELDALDPTVINDLIENEILNLIDPERWEAAKAAEAMRRDTLKSVSENWSKIEQMFMPRSEQ